MKDDPKKIVVRRYIQEVVNTGSVERIGEFVHPQYIDHSNPSETGVEVAKRHIYAVRSTWADLAVTVEEQISEDDFVVTRVIGRATHHGEWLGIMPTQKLVTIEAVNIDRIRDGKIIEHRGVADSFQALFAIGALRPV